MTTMTIDEAAELLAPLVEGKPSAETVERYIEALITRVPKDDPRGEVLVRWGDRFMKSPNHAMLVMKLLSYLLGGGVMDPVTILQAGLITGLAAGYLAGRDDAQREQLEQLLGKAS